MCASQVEIAGQYTLFLRWTGGDTTGGGDSLYATVRMHGSDELMTGPDTYKPKMVNLLDVPGQFTGCCYHHTTHVCECYTPAMNSSACELTELGTWQR